MRYNVISGVILVYEESREWIVQNLWWYKLVIQNESGEMIID